MSDNAKVQEYLDTNQRIPRGVYEIDASYGVQLRSEYTIPMTGVVFKIIPNSLEKYTCLWVRKCELSMVKGLTIIGERFEHKGNSGEWGMGIFLRDAEDITIQDCKISRCWGDGIYIGHGTNKNIVVRNNISDLNRRQGMSVISVSGLVVIGNRFSNTRGTAPSDGIDFEPDSKDHVIENVHVTGNVFKNNSGAGVEVAAKKGTVRHLKVVQNSFDKGDKPTKTDKGGPRPSLWAKFLALFKNYSAWPKTIRIS